MPKQRGCPLLSVYRGFQRYVPKCDRTVLPINSQIASQIDMSQSRQSSSYGPSPQAWMESSFASITKQLFEFSIKKPVVLVLEDIHWADSASLALLNYISRLSIQKES